MNYITQMQFQQQIGLGMGGANTIQDLLQQQQLLQDKAKLNQDLPMSQKINIVQNANFQPVIQGL